MLLFQSAEHAQIGWFCRDLASNFYENPNKASYKFLQNQTSISEAHEELWPGLPVPSMPRLADESLPDRVKETQPILVPTSLMISSLLCLFTLPKRTSDARGKVADFLRNLVDKACRVGLPVKVALINPDGTFRWKAQTLKSATAGTLFARSMLEAVRLAWTSDMRSESKPWISSGPDHAHLADFICFALEPVPAKVQGKQRELLALKSQLRPVALGLLTQLACFYGNAENVRQITDAPVKRVKVLDSQAGCQRRSKGSVWPRFGLALQLLVQLTAPGR